MYNIFAELQMFADGAGTLVNATGSYVNAYTGATTAFEGKNTLDPQLKTYYDTELLENARVDMVYAQFAKKQALPANHGKTVEWRKWNTFEKAGQLQEGVIPTGQKFSSSVITGSINQYGTYTAVTDILEMRGFDDVIIGATEEMGASLAETQEYLIRQALLTGTNVLYADNVKKDGTFVSTPASAADMGASDADGFAFLTPDVIAKGVTKMKKNKVPMINGRYYCVVHPSVAYDLRNNDAWIEAHKYAATGEIFNGEIGELHGVRFVETTNAKITEQAVNGGKAMVYTSIFLGKDAYGIIDPEGGSMEMIVKDRSEVGGPLEQYSTAGYKFEDCTCILYPERLLRVESCSAYSGVDEAN